MVSCRAQTPVTDVRHHRGRSICHSILPPISINSKGCHSVLYYWIGILTVVGTMANTEELVEIKKDNLKPGFVKGCYKCNITH